jgi:hypothetical protein
MDGLEQDAPATGRVGAAGPHRPTGAKLGTECSKDGLGLQVPAT